MKEAFLPIKLEPRTIGLIHLVNEIIEDLVSQGYRLTLRQVYYQLVQRNVIRNKQSEYKRLGSILNDGRLMGLVDWDAIEDRTRHIRGVQHFINPSDIVNVAADSFRIDKWANQPYRVEVWVEKDALAQVIEKACTPLDVDYFSCRGYTSQSSQYGASKRLINYHNSGQQPVIIHLGDHDPSGVDMSRDIEDRLNRFCEPHIGAQIEVNRIALTKRQIRQYDPPPNPAKSTDSRFKGYERKHGDDCWELDALDVRVIDKLITDTILSYRDDDLWNELNSQEEKDRAVLRDCANRWTEVEKHLAKPIKAKRKKPNT